MSTAMAGPRTDHWSGFDFGFDSPFPSVGGVMVGFNVNDDARLSTGLGLFGPFSTYGFDAKVFLSPGNWAPYFGAGMDYMVGSHQKYLLWDLQFDRAFVPYLEIGLDFQSDLGVHTTFNLGGAAPNGHVIALPGVAIGWYF